MTIHTLPYLNALSFFSVRSRCIKIGLRIELTNYLLAKKAFMLPIFQR